MTLRLDDEDNDALREQAEAEGSGKPMTFRDRLAAAHAATRRMANEERAERHRRRDSRHAESEPVATEHVERPTVTVATASQPHGRRCAARTTTSRAKLPLPARSRHPRLR